MMILKYFVTEKLIEEMENAKDVLKSWNANWFEYMNMDIMNYHVEHLEHKERIQVSELEQYESTIRNLFEKSQGSIFSNKDKDHKIDLDESDNKKTHHM